MLTSPSPSTRSLVVAALCGAFGGAFGAYAFGGGTLSEMTWSALGGGLGGFLGARFLRRRT